MSIEMANVMAEDANHHVTARQIEASIQIMFGPKYGHKPIYPQKPTPAWVAAIIAEAFAPTTLDSGVQIRL